MVLRDKRSQVPFPMEAKNFQTLRPLGVISSCLALKLVEVHTSWPGLTVITIYKKKMINSPYIKPQILLNAIVNVHHLDKQRKIKVHHLILCIQNINFYEGITSFDARNPSSLSLADTSVNFIVSLP